MTFLETWCFLTVVLVAVTAAMWLHGLARDATRTHVILSFLGFGALGGAAALVLRIVRTAMKLRAKWEELSFGVDKAPADPTDGLLGKRWWQVPTLFAVAWAIAWWLLESVGATRLFAG